MGALSDIAGRSGMRHRLALELSVLVAVGTFLGLIGPFGSERVPFALRMVYWLACIVGGGAIGCAVRCSGFNARSSAPSR